jgi:hypothetical protein
VARILARGTIVRATCTLAAGVLLLSATIGTVRHASAGGGGTTVAPYQASRDACRRIYHQMVIAEMDGNDALWEALFESWYYSGCMNYDWGDIPPDAGVPGDDPSNPGGGFNTPGTQPGTR